MTMTGTPAINLVDPDLYAEGDPFAAWSWLRAHDPVHRHAPTHLPAFWALTRYDDVRTVFRDARTFSSAHGILLRPREQGSDPGGGRTLALTDPPRHGQLRRIIEHWFATPSVRGLEDRMRSTVRAVIDRAVEQETCDFVTEIAARLPLYVICGLMGVPAEDHDKLFQLTCRAFGAEEALRRSAAHIEIMRYFVMLAARRARDPRDDLVSALATATIEGTRLSTEDVLLNCDNLLVGGTENVRLTVSGGMHAFLTHPAQWSLLVEDPGLMPGAVEEVLRFTSSATHIMRTATAPVDLRDRRIAAGDQVTLWLPSANRDEAVFEDPDRFDIRRTPNRHLTLGSGEHFCVGSLLARSQLRVLFEELAANVHIEQTGPVRRLRSIVVHGLAELPVRLAYLARSGTAHRGEA
jgi:cytochrome P450